MKKSLIALAVAGLVSAPAFAATSNVDIAGTLNVSLSMLDADSADNGSNLNVSSNSSNILFKGSEDLGGGLKGIWQIQTYFSAGGTGNTDTGVLGESIPDGVGSGNTFVGLSGNFGTALLGKHEAPAKLIGRSVDLFGDQIGDNRNFTARTGRSLTSLDEDTSGTRVYSGGFDLRPNNVMAYVSPSFSGFQGAIAYVTNVGASQFADFIDVGAATDDSVDAWSASLKYENGPLMLGFGYQVHNLSEIDSGLGDENVMRLAASYKIGDVRVVALYQKEDDLNSFNMLTDTLVSNNVDRTTWGVGASYAMGPILLKAQYYTTNDANAANQGADMWALGVDYELSKRTKVQLAYATTDNESASGRSAFGGGHGDQPSIDTGKNPSGFSVGVRHAF